MARVEPRLGHPRRDIERQPLEMIKGVDSLTIRNPGTNEHVILPKDATPGEIAAARKKLRPTESSPLDENAKVVMEKIYGGAPKQSDPDPEPYVPISPGRLRDKALAAHEAWQNRQAAAKARDQQNEDRRRLVDGFKQALADERGATAVTPVETPAETPDPPIIDMSGEFKALTDKFNSILNPTKKDEVSSDTTP